jgi:hypothetical protein
MKGFLAKKSIFLKLMTVTLSASILGSWGIFYWLTGNIGDVNLSLEGLNTCFSRVSQNYSGKMIGANQPYTKSSFYHMTEECFSDLESVIKKSFFLRQDQGLENSFKELVKKSYWFHRDDIVKSEFTSDEDGKGSSVTKNYQEIENIYELVVASISKSRSDLNNRKKWVFYIGLMSVVSMAFISLFMTGTIRQESESYAVPSNNLEDLSVQNHERIEVGRSIENSNPEDIFEYANPVNTPLSPGPEKFDIFFNRFLRMIAPRLIRKGINFDFSVDAGIPRVLNPEQVNRDLEQFFERAINFSFSSSRVSRVDCYLVSAKKMEIRFYDNGICLLKPLNNFKNVKSTDAMVLGVELKHSINIGRKGKVKSIVKGKKRDLMREMRS